MGYFIITIATILVLVVILKRNIKRNNRFIYRIGRLIKNINEMYIKIFTSGKVFKNIILGILIVCAELMTFIGLVSSIYKYLNIGFLNIGEPLVKLILGLISFVVVFYLIGYVLLFSEKINGFIKSTEDKDFRVDFLLSYFLTSTYLTVLLIFPNEFRKMAYIILGGMIISYLLNIKLILSILINPQNVRKINEDDASFSRIMVVSILILIMIIFNLYVAVCAVSNIGGVAFKGADGMFSLFYYTIITFTTIGYGDIVPVTILARIVSIVISITSVICITIFLSSILSYREKLKNED